MTSVSATVEPKATRRDVGSALVVGVMTVVGWLTLGAGLVFGAFAVTGQLDTAVPVKLSPEAPARMDVVLPCVEGWSLEGSSCEPAATPEEWPGGEALPVRHTGGLVAGINEAGVTALLATAPLWAGLLTSGAVVLVLIPVLRNMAAGQLFRRGNARRLGTAAGVIVLGWVIATVGPVLAAPTIIGLIEAAPRYTGFESFDMPAGWLVSEPRITWWPLLPALLLLALAGATRQGTRIMADIEGLA